MARKVFYFGNFNRFATMYVQLSTPELRQLCGKDGEWFVQDAEDIDPLCGLPSVIVQADSKEDAIAITKRIRPEAFVTQEN